MRSLSSPLSIPASKINTLPHSKIQCQQCDSSMYFFITYKIDYTYNVAYTDW